MHDLPLLPARTNVLFVGDNIGRLKDISFELQRAWCSILWETKGLDGVRTARLECPDLIICERELPDISGLDVCRRVRGDSGSSQIPFILIGASQGESADLDALELDVDECFALPVDSERLLSRVFWLIERGPSRPNTSGHHYAHRSQRNHLDTIMKESSDLLLNLSLDTCEVYLGRRGTTDPDTGARGRIGIGMHLIGVAADPFEDEAFELDSADSHDIERSTLAP